MIDFTMDAETIPSQDRLIQQMILDGIKADSRLVDPVKIAKDIEAKKVDAIDKAGLDGATNHIICLGFKIADEKAVSYMIDNVAQEKDMLRAFCDMLEKQGKQLKFIGHNIINFDFRVLKQRLMILGIKPPALIPFGTRPWDESVYDTMHQWTQDPKAYIKLDKLCKILGIAGKSFDASQVYKMWQSGQQAKIASCCEDDVEITHAASKKMRFII